MAAPAAHFSAPAAHFSAPAAHYSAPHFSAPAAHYSAPHFSAPAAHFSAPQARFGSPSTHFAAPSAHFGSPHMAEARPMREAERFGRQPGMGEHQSAHYPASMHIGEARPKASEMFKAQGNRAEHGQPAERGLAAEHGQPGEHGFPAGHGQAGERGLVGHPSEHENANHLYGMHGNEMRGNEMQANQPTHYAPITGSSPARLKEEHHEAMMQLSQGHGERPMAPNGAQRAGENFRHMATGAFAGGALGGLAAHQLASAEHGQAMQGERSRAGAPIEARRGEFGSKGTTGLRNVPPSPAYANPRMTGRKAMVNPTFSRNPAERLTYRHGVGLFPRGGDRRSGVPGIYDPGGYLRTPERAGTRINPGFIRDQITRMPNWRNAMALNQRNIVAQRNAWPWTLPQQATWWNPSTWGNGWGWNNGYGNPAAFDPYVYGNPYGYGSYGALDPYFGYPYGVYGPSNFWNAWDNYDDWNNWNGLYANAYPYYGGANPGIFGFLGDLFSGAPGVGLGSGNPNDWLNNLLYFSAYSINGNTYPTNYFAMNGYVPTPYVFNVATGQVWQPGVGYSDYLPEDYRAPITVAVQEVVPQFGAKGKIAGYQPQTFYNDAYWDDSAQSYGYYDYRKKFHWVTFPWLSSYAQVPGAVQPPAQNHIETQIRPVPPQL
jgi:hypothetical protein